MSEFREPSKTATAKAVKAYESARANGASSSEAMRAALMVAAAANPVVPDSVHCEHRDLGTDDYGATRCNHCGLVF